MLSKVKITDNANSLLNLGETKFYEVDLPPPCLFWFALEPRRLTEILLFWATLNCVCEIQPKTCQNQPSLSFKKENKRMKSIVYFCSNGFIETVCRKKNSEDSAWAARAKYNRKTYQNQPFCFIEALMTRPQRNNCCYSLMRRREQVTFWY